MFVGTVIHFFESETVRTRRTRLDEITTRSTHASGEKEFAQIREEINALGREMKRESDYGGIFLLTGTFLMASNALFLSGNSILTRLSKRTAE